MRKLYRIQTILTGLGCIWLAMLGNSATVSAQGLIAREARVNWGTDYENFSRYDIRKYPRTLDDRYSITSPSANPVWQGPADPVSFDQFGNYLLPGGNAYNLTWDKSDVGASRLYNSNLAGIFNNLMVASDDMGNWSTQFMIGQNIRTIFTPSTLKKTNFNGIRMDASSRKNSFTFIASVGDDWGTDAAARARYSTRRRNLFGGYWESVLGDVLKLGGTFVAQQRGTQAYSNQDIAGGSYGLSERDDTYERYMYVVITSDSPEDESISAVVYDVKPIVDGKNVEVPYRVFKIPNVQSILKYSGGKFTDRAPVFSNGNDGINLRRIENYQYNNGSWFLGMVEDSGGSNESAQYENRDAILRQFFKKGVGKTAALGYVNILDPNKPNDPTGRMFGADTSDGYVEARGTDVIIYEFLIPKAARKVEFNVNVANDYCIDIIAALPNSSHLGYGGWDEDPNGSTWSNNFNIFYDKKHCIKSKGVINDHSNAQWVKVQYNKLTGMSVYGLNADFNWRGFALRAEINEYNSLWAYPINELLSGAATEKYSTRAWFVNAEKDFGKWSVGGELFNYPNDYMQYWGTIDDNDDNNSANGGDEYPNLNIDWDGSSNNYHQDVNWIGRPYITYYFDSIRWGDDFNHNGIVDERENDNQMDLPYDRDSKGSHYFIKLKPRTSTMMTAGHYDVEQEYRDGRNLTDYFKVQHFQKYSKYFEYGIYHRTERTKDDYKSTESFSTTLDRTGLFDNSAYRDSWVNSTLLRTKLTFFRNLNIINQFKYDSINRVGDQHYEGSPQQRTMRAPSNIVKSVSVHKIDYTYRLADLRVFPDVYFNGMRILKEYRIKEFSIMPQFKFVNEYFTADTYMRDKGGHGYNYFPVLRLDYRLAPKTMFRCAFQGLPGFEEVSRDSSMPVSEYNRQRYFVGIEQQTSYNAFALLVTSGIRRDDTTYVERFRRRDTGYTEYFVELQVEASR